MRVGIYCRLSEEDRDKQSETDDSSSIRNQKSMLIQYADEKGWEIYKIYSDDDYTGSDRKRPEFCRLLEDAKQHRFDIVLCKTQSRFTRELELVEKYIHGLFPVWGIRFVSVVDNADTADKGNKKSRQINGLVNEWYLEDMSENIRSVLTNRRKNGYHIGAFALYGYKKDPDQKGHLIVDEEAAAVVREVFTLYSQGYGKTAIARMLNDRGIPNPTEYKRLHGLRYMPPKTRQASLWKYYSIAAMLRNEIYIGNMVQGKYGSVSYKTKQNKPRPRERWYRVENTHEPVISRELWDRVQELLRQKSKPCFTGQIGLFAGKARCAGCGYILRSSKASVRHGGQHYLQCPNRHFSIDSCPGAFISVSRLENTVIQELTRISEKYLDKAELERDIEFCGDLQTQRQSLAAELLSYRKKAEEYAKGIKELYLDKVKGILTEKDYLELSGNFFSERARLEAEISDAENRISVLDGRIGSGDNRRAMIERYTNPEHLTREIVDTMIDYIIVGRRIPGIREVPVEIHWNF